MGGMTPRMLASPRPGALRMMSPRPGASPRMPRRRTTAPQAVDGPPASPRPPATQEATKIIVAKGDDDISTESSPEESPILASTAARKNMPRLSLNTMDTMDTTKTEDRKNARRATDAALGDLEAAKEKLDADGIDIKMLTRAFQQIDDQGDGVLDLSEFRNLWRVVFPQRPLDEASWRYTERIFYEIDCDGSGEISWDEILAYLNKSRRLVERGKPPTETIEKIFRFVGNSEDLYSDARSLASYAVAIFKLFSQAVVLTSIVVLMIESLPSMQPENADDAPGDSITFAIESGCIGFFTVELLLWMFSYPSSEMYVDAEGKNQIIAKFEEIYPQPENIRRVKWRLVVREVEFYIDLVSILPYYIILIVGSSTKNASPLVAVRTLRLLRLLRILRILRLGKSGLHGKIPELGAALYKSIMSLIFLVFLIIIATTIAATFMFYAELDQTHFDNTHLQWRRDHDSEYIDAGALIQFQSIPDSLWWGIVTLTTVGYGDFFPTTVAGKIIASLTMLCGLIVIGYPITILTGTFQLMEIERFEKEEKMDRCREFYNGIKEWVKNATEQQGSGKEATSPLEMSGIGGAPGPTPLSQQNLQLLHAIVELETKFSDTLAAIEGRVRKMERYDFATKSMLLPDYNSDDTASESSSSGSFHASAEVVKSLHDINIQPNTKEQKNAPFGKSSKEDDAPKPAMKISLPSLKLK